jgi:hypothetical protein
VIELDTIHTEQHGPILLVRQFTKASDRDACAASGAMIAPPRMRCGADPQHAA